MLHDLYDSGGNAGIICAAVESAKRELRAEVDADIMALGAAVFGTTSESGQLTKMGILHSLMSLDKVLAFLCEKFNVTPAEVEAWDAEKRKLATVQPKPAVTGE